MTSHILVLGPQEATAHWSVSTCHHAPVTQPLLMCSVHQSTLVPQGWQDLSHPLPSPAFSNIPPTPPSPPLTPHHFAQGNFPSCQLYRCSFLKLTYLENLLKDLIATTSMTHNPLHLLLLWSPSHAVLEIFCHLSLFSLFSPTL